MGHLVQVHLLSLQSLVNLVAPMEEFASATTSVRAHMALAVQIAKTRLVHFTVKMAAFARCLTIHVNVVTDSTEPDATKSNYPLNN